MLLFAFSDELEKIAVSPIMAARSFMIRDKIREGGIMRPVETDEERKKRELKIKQSIKTAEQLTAKQRFVRSRTGNPNSRSAKYYAKKRREARLAKTAGPVKRQMTVDGLRMKLEYEKGDIRFKGAPHERKVHDHYGFIPGTGGQGEDGEAIDIYMNPKPTPPLGPVYRVKQLKKNTGEFDESKYMVGYDSAAQAKKAFLRNMPGWAFGSMASESLDAFKKKVGQSKEKR